MSPNQGNETRRRDSATFQRFTSSNDERKHLRVSLAQRSKESAAFGELPKERLRHFSRSSGHENRIVGRVLPPAQRAVAGHEGDVAHTRGAYRGAR